MLKTPVLRWLTAAVAATLSLAFACQSGGPPDIRADRVVMVSYDSVGADLAWRWIGEGVAASPDGLAGMASSGLSAERLRMIDPTLTAVEHTALATGRDAAATGIVSNRFHLPGTPITDSVSGFTTASATDTLWRAARRRGLRVATLVWPGVDGVEPDKAGDFGAVWPGPPLAGSEIVELAPDSAGTTGEVPSYDGLTPLMWSVSIELGQSSPERVEALVALVDADPNGLPRYDTVAVRLADEAEWSYAAEMEWLELRFDARGPHDSRPRSYGAWCKVVRIDRLTGNLTFYRGGANRLHAYPEAFEDRLAEAIGPWPGEPDMKIAAWWLDLAEGVDLDVFVEQSERLDRYLDRMAEWVLANENPDLVLAYHPAADEYLHANLITDPLQWAFSPGRAVAAAEGLKRVGRSIDASVAATWRLLDPARDALVVVSDHGQVPIFEVVRPNRALADAGLVTISDDGGNIAADTPMVAIADAAAINLYLNLEGREPGGVVSAAEAAGYLQRAARVLADLQVEGRPAVERIFTRDEAAAIGLRSPNSGDLVVFLAPGFAGSDELDGPALAPSRYYGQHGYLASHDEMCGMLFARGAGIERRRLGEVAAVSVAPMVARWLGFELPSP
jgi:predicted AlkP superfamily phosphohydrolase/phosphomutase